MVTGPLLWMFLHNKLNAFRFHIAHTLSQRHNPLAGGDMNLKKPNCLLHGVTFKTLYFGNKDIKIIKLLFFPQSVLSL